MGKQWVYTLVAVVVVLAGQRVGWAQQGDAGSAASRAKVIVDQANGLKVRRPDGWVSETPGKGAVASFEAAGDAKAQLDVRVSPGVGREQSKSFFSSFHTSLQKAGFVKKEVRDDIVYGGHQGRETEYVSASKEREFRLIVWQLHRDDAAFMVVGFFPKERRDAYYEAFQKVAKSMTFE